ncbi:MAG: DUF1587 domain-containing protein, partial [Planctomycetaceae bacterium]
MKTSFTVAITVALSVGSILESRADESTTFILSTFNVHCIRCHGQDGRIEGKVNLRALKSDNDLRRHVELLEDLIKVLSDRRMPPKDEPDLPAATREQMVVRLRKILGQASQAQAFNAAPMRRMNRFQYNNAVVDLLALNRDIFRLNERLIRRRHDYFRPETGKMPAEVRVSCRPLSKDIDNQRPEGFRGVAAFPQDQRAEHGFDNRGDHLTLSPLLMESFLQLSQTIVDSPDLNPAECRNWNRLFAPPGPPARDRYEAESGVVMKVVGTPRGRAGTQEMSGFGSGWSGDAQLFWVCPEKGLDLTVSFTVTESGSGLRFGFTKARDYGMFELYLDNMKVGDIVDLYDPEVLQDDHVVTGLKISSGPHTLRFRCTGKNDRSTRHFFGLDYVDVTGGTRSVKPDPAVVTARDVIRVRLAQLLRRAFRRPVDPETLDRFTMFAERQL